MTSPFLRQVVSASGLSAVFADAVITRACKRAGVDPERLDPASLAQALEAIEATLRVYLPPEEREPRLAALRRLARGAP
jgi:hypothetical protein